jgi:hypothetical protein
MRRLQSKECAEGGIMFHKALAFGLAALAGATGVGAKTDRTATWAPLSPQQQQLIDEAISQEKVIISQIRKSTPVVESYIQNVRPDDKLDQVPVSDQYMIGRVDFGKAFVADEYASRGTRHGWFRDSFHFLTRLSLLFHLENSPTGFMDMMFIDPSGFDEQHYEFRYVRRDFLGTVRTVVFDVRPRVRGAGRFYGRIWIEDQNGCVVRFNGTYTNNPVEEVNHYFHFDSWRTNIQPGIWAPASIYVEDVVQTFSRRTQSFRGHTSYWGYSLKLPARDSDAESMEVEGAQDQSDSGQDVSPLEAKRQWIAQAEQNVLDRLTQAGLIAPPSDFDKILDQVVKNIIISNDLQLPSDIHCRLILTDPLETLAIGNTILISKGLVDVLPNEESLAAMISFELAHILMGHHIDTRYAFNDRLLFPDSATFQRIMMNHSDLDNEEAAKRAVDLFTHSNYREKAAGVGLFLEQISARQKQLPALLTARLGDPLVRKDGQPWLNELAKGAPKLEMDDLSQIAALPLNSRLKVDPWDDKISTVNFAPALLLNASDKMPLEISPVFYRLQRYQESTGAGAPPAKDMAQRFLQSDDDSRTSRPITNPPIPELQPNTQ